MIRQPLSFAALCVLPGAVVTRDEQRGVITVTFYGLYVGMQDLTIDEVDAMLNETEEVKK